MELSGIHDHDEHFADIDWDDWSRLPIAEILPAERQTSSAIDVLTRQSLRSNESNGPQEPTLLVPFSKDNRCRNCRQIRTSEKRRTFSHHKYFDLKISASRGCPICKFLFHEVAEKSPAHNLDKKLVIICEQDEVLLSDYIGRPRRFEIVTWTNDPRSNYRRRSAGPKSEEYWEIIRQWLSNCQSHHEACQTSLKLDKMPTRVLDVKQGVRLIESSTLSEPSPFLTLSHCWGQGNMVVTTKERYERFKQNMDINSLPATFVDAITLTRRLGYRYLWIDTFCIIQDSFEDWQIEAVRLGSYYQYCILNISALEGQSSGSGFLWSRTEDTLRMVGLENGEYLRPACSPWKNVFQNAPLSRRAWVLQERLMATRVLHITRDELLWECNTMSTRESCVKEYTTQRSSPKWNDEHFKRAIAFPEFRIDADVILPRLSPSERLSVMLRWYSIIEEYSGLHLTMASDVFPAISAIAQHFQAVIGDQYVAGLWFHDLHTGLLWYRHQLTRHRRPPSFVAPTWSWASTLARMKLLPSPLSTVKNNELKANFVSPRPIPESESFLLGRIVEAGLTMNAICATVWCKGSDGPTPFNDPFLKIVLNIFDDRGVMIGTGYQDDIDADGDVSQCIAVFICERDEPELNAAVVFFLLLAEAKDSKPGRELYQRIGIGQTADPYKGGVVSYGAFKESERRDITIV